jgi:hypothetical protein
MSKKTQGGRRKGAGRKPGPDGVKQSITIRLSPPARKYIAETGNPNAAVQAMIDGDAKYQEWRKLNNQFAPCNCRKCGKVFQTNLMRHDDFNCPDCRKLNHTDSDCK